MEARIKKWGNSLALRIPSSLAKEAGLQYESPVELSLIDGRLVVVPTSKPKLTLDHLLAQVTEDNIHAEMDTGPAVGKEAW